MTEVEDNHIINHSQHVIIEMPSGTVKIVNLKPNINISLGKFGSFNSNNLIGKYFGLSYEIYGRNGDLRPVGHVVKNISLEETEANNQLIVDDTTVQKLTFEEVLKLKEQGLEGTIKTEEIINKMIDSHSEFSKKTEFSKAKYIERKKKKFTKAFTPVRPTMYTIAKYFFQKNPDKIRYLRVDTLSHMLSLANVRAYSKLLVVDDTQGLIVTSILERMGGFGKVVAVHEGDNHNYDIIRYMNYPKRITDILHTVPFCMVDPGVPNDPFDLKTEEELAALTDDEKRSYLRRKAYFEGRAYSRKLLFDGDFDGLIISSGFTPISVVKEFLKYLNGSRPIVIYSFSKEILLETAYWMRRSSEFLFADVTECSMRQYQVLPGRMHPEMNMSAGGGYLLSALRIIHSPEDDVMTPEDQSMASVEDTDVSAKKQKV